MSEPRLTELFSKHAPRELTPAESAAALDDARPAFMAARSRRRTGLAGAAMMAILLVAGATMSLGGETVPTPEEFVAPPITSTTLAAHPVAEHFESPGGSIDATVDAGELALVASMAADGYVAMIDLMTAERLEVSFTGPDRHVITLAIDDEGMIVEVDVAADPDGAVPPTSTTVAATPTTTTATSSGPSTTSAPTTTTLAPPTTTTAAATTTTTTAAPPPEEAGSGWGWDWDWNPGNGWDWDWNPGNGWDWDWGDDDNNNDDDDDDG